MFARLPLTALRTFESAARLASFRAAAMELNVTPTAVSHQIRGLEQWLGTLLFERLGRGVRLSEAGEKLQRSLHGAFMEIDRSLNTLRPPSGEQCVSLNTMPAFAALWLVPRLGRFYRRHPGIRVRIETSNELVELERDASLDLVIRCGLGEYPQLHQQQLMGEHFAAYAAPQLLEDMPQRRPDLIGVGWDAPMSGLPVWESWAEQAGENWVLAATRRDYPDEHYALQAAIAGQGLVLASSVLVSDSLASGLLRPYHADISLPGAPYLALCVPGRERQPAVKALLDWLAEEVLRESTTAVD
ncbi:LysR family transcriptional regulator [Pseudomonas sp. PDM16]|uniref:LysR substrate-binding domain-containing protein n=1 Tax=Pseudomonas sp. PDM16 TaxID=2769292 RepID=UPI001783BF8E|nr:LysR substrate-binding domain-containing protein [Pseudomonas sp. PDM16]MBD9416259.1 LysR family transcriptional regulator [Pseudomonas sp. PDM16]